MELIFALYLITANFLDYQTNLNQSDCYKFEIMTKFYNCFRETIRAFQDKLKPRERLKLEK